MKTFHRRLFFFAGGVCLFFLLLLGRLVQLQWLEGEKFSKVGAANVLREIPIQAPRGKILDRHGVVLAENRPSFVLTLNLAQVKDPESAIRTLGGLLDLEAGVIRERITPRKPLPPFTPLVVAKDLSLDEVAMIRGKISRLNGVMPPGQDLSGIDLQVRYERVYPFKEKIGHVLGYVREVGEKDLADWNKQEPGRVSPGDKVGVAGMEKAFDETLRGYDGHREVFVDARGREVDLSDLGKNFQLEQKAAQGGMTIESTLDARLMQVADAALENQVGAVVALDPRNGEVLVMLSKPAYNPEDLSGTISAGFWKSLQDNPDKILLNRALQAAYPPGSTYKIVTATAALAENEIDLTATVTCPGYYRFGGRDWGCWNKKGHGKMDLKHALIHSCDVFFYKMGEKLGPDRLAHYAKLLGLGQKSEVLQDDERSGLIPTREWKEKNKKVAWLPAESLGIAIGQGLDLVTPTQNARMIAQFSNGGKKLTPHLLKAVINADGNREEFSVPPLEAMPLNLSAQEFKEIKAALFGVVEAPGGTGAKARVKGIKVAGKTGTAQVVGFESVKKVEKGVKTGDHAWFVAFAPEEPEIAIAVIVEHAGHGGSVAAPVAQRVLEAYFNNQEKK